ncbi:DUF4123 domain-containing protein [Variovorax sp. IB41]|uniref:DUF4123 domain-containing protein n=1 Tax=Variovorax sp. IB41 TaxID=2779370 RepID=UPI0018E77481|nr:DUF4123 domain-containing protein [Variovorax sp. IB41]MBJ2158967.1 DUF4123 domain-containing protein [Variovorax sp. IB41]
MRDIHSFHGLGQVQALIDPFFGDPFDTGGIALPSLPGDRIRKLKIKHAEAEDSKQPYLLGLGAGSAEGAVLHDLQSLSISEAAHIPKEGEVWSQSRSAAGFLVCKKRDADLHSLVLLLERMGSLKDSSGQKRLFRFWDPRVLQHVDAASHTMASWRRLFSTPMGRRVGAIDWHFFDAAAVPRILHIEPLATENEPWSPLLADPWRKELERWSCINKMSLQLLIVGDTSEATPALTMQLQEISARNVAPFLGLDRFDPTAKVELALLRLFENKAIEEDAALMDALAEKSEAGFSIFPRLDDIAKADVERALFEFRDQ